jgi:signal transduction histidine kinase
MERNVIDVYRFGLFGRMVMGVAHEVDNHLSVVIGFSELIEMTASNEPKVRDAAGKVLSAGEKIGAIIKCFSHYARPHAPVSEAFPPGEMLAEILLFARYDLGRGGVVVAPPGPIPAGVLHGDRRDLGLALLALLFNGAEAMADSGGTLATEVGRDDRGWVFSISDQGPGVAQELEGRIYAPGFTTKSQPFRTGMGLPVARQIITAGGGTLALANARGGGCVATVRLPAQPPGQGGE